MKKWISNIIDNAIPNSHRDSNLVEIIKMFVDIMQERGYSDNEISPIELINDFDTILNSLDLNKLKDIKLDKLPSNTVNILKQHLDEFIEISHKYFESKGTNAVVNLYKYLVGEFKLTNLNADDEIFYKLGIKINQSISSHVVSDVNTHLPNVFLVDANAIDSSVLNSVFNEIRPIGVLFILYLNLIIDMSNTIYIDSMSSIGLCDRYNKTRVHCSDLGYQSNFYTENLYTIEELTGVTYQDAIDNKDLLNTFNSCITMYTI